MRTEQETYFRNEWNDEIKLVAEVKNTKYHVLAYPLDQYECDTLVIRIYEDDTYSDEKEYGNGIWIDTDKGYFNGNDEITLEQETKDVIIDLVFDELKEREII